MKPALERLKVNGRRCDGCAAPLLRFTTACEYDNKRNEVLGSVCGCARTYRGSRACALCACQVGRHFIFAIGRTEVCGVCLRKEGQWPPRYTAVRVATGVHHVGVKLRSTMLVRGQVGMAARAEELAQRFNQEVDALLAQQV